MSYADAFAPIEAEYKRQVMADTWGHLAPKKDRKYWGRIVYALGCLGSDDLNPTVLCLDMADLNSSPWLYEDMQDFLGIQEGVAGGVYEFIGSFRNYNWSGTIRSLLQADTHDGADPVVRNAWRPGAPKRPIHCWWQKYSSSRTWDGKWEEAEKELLNWAECWDKIRNGEPCCRHQPIYPVPRGLGKHLPYVAGKQKG